MRPSQQLAMFLLTLCHAASARADGGTRGGLDALGDGILLGLALIGVVAFVGAVAIFRSLRSSATSSAQSLGAIVLVACIVGSTGATVHVGLGTFSEAESDKRQGDATVAGVRNDSDTLPVAKRYSEEGKLAEMERTTVLGYALYRWTSWTPRILASGAILGFSIWALARVRGNIRRGSTRPS